jgi:hypothetical protein
VIPHENAVPYYQGHLTIWDGGGNNAKSQTETGFTLDFEGSGAAGTLSLHVDSHQTTNAHGTLTASPTNVTISCGG